MHWYLCHANFKFKIGQNKHFCKVCRYCELRSFVPLPVEFNHDWRAVSEYAFLVENSRTESLLARLFQCDSGSRGVIS